jgi:hypothetical protein
MKKVNNEALFAIENIVAWSSKVGWYPPCDEESSQVTGTMTEPTITIPSVYVVQSTESLGSEAIATSDENRQIFSIQQCDLTVRNCPLD